MTKKILYILFTTSIIFSSCQKEKTTYSLNFEATHNITQINMFADPGAYYSWSVDDEDGNVKWSQSGFIDRETTTNEMISAETGDWIFIYISVDDVFCYGSVTCSSTDGDIYLSAFTDNSLLPESNSTTARISIDGEDVLIPVIERKFQLK